MVKPARKTIRCSQAMERRKIRTLKVRNDKLKTSVERKKWLELDPGPQRIDGGDATTVANFAIDRDLKKSKPNGETKLKIRTLGQLRSDADGRLIVIGGMGQSDFDPGLGRETIGHFANNDGWFDDMSDGPVDAELTIDGAKQDVVGAWAARRPAGFCSAYPQLPFDVRFARGRRRA